MKKFLSFLLLAVVGLAQPTPVQVVEATTAQVVSGTAGAPYYISPRRLAGGGGPGVFTSVGLGNGTFAAPSLYFTADPDTGLYRSAANTLGFATNGTAMLTLGTVYLGSASASTGSVLIRSENTGDATAPVYTFTGDADTGLYRAGTNLIGFAANGASAGTAGATEWTFPSTLTSGLQLYNTADQTTNAERGELLWGSNVFQVGSRTIGTATGRVFSIFSQGSNAAASYTRVDVNNASFPSLRFGVFTSVTNTTPFSTSGTGTNIVFVPATNAATSGTNIGLSLTPTYNQASGNAANTDLLVNRTETAVGSGAQNLIDLQVGGTSRFLVSNTGLLRLGTSGAFTIQDSSQSGRFTGTAQANTYAHLHSTSTSAVGHTFTGGTMSASSGTQTALAITQTYNQSSTAAATDLLINRTQTAVGSGAQLLADFQVGAVSQISIDNAGLLAFKTATANTTGLRFGGDTGIYRTAAGQIALDGTSGGFATILFRTSGGTQASIQANAGTFTLSSNGTLALTLGTSQQATFAGALITTPQALSGAGAVNTTTSATFLTSTGAGDALTLANATAGQIKYIVHQVDGGSAVLTPTSKIGFTTITFTNVGDSVTLIYTAAGWAIVGVFGAVAA